MGKKSKSGHGGKAKQSQVAAAASALPVGMSGPVVGRCKLDPGLKAPWFQSLIVKSDNSAFQLETWFCLSSSHHYSKADAERAKIHEDYKVRVVQVERSA